MKTKLVLWGHDTEDKKILVAAELKQEENKVEIWTFPGEKVTEDFANDMMQKWRLGEEIEFPVDRKHFEQNLSMAESMLPEEIKVDRPDLVTRAQTEWHFIVLSTKMHKTYLEELSDLKEKIDKLTSFEPAVWEELKGFWSKVQRQIREKNLFREHINTLRDNTNELFARLKELRSALDAEFKDQSKENFDKFSGLLEQIENKIKEGLNLSSIFDELKSLQKDFKEAKFTKEHRSKIWERLDGAFKEVKKKRYGESSVRDHSPMERLKRRYDGLINAITKMERSINRDKADLDFQDRKIETSGGQLEAQIRQAKVMMIKERISSKEEKLNEMMVTKGELEMRMEKEKGREAARAKQAEIEEAKKVAQEKIAREIKEAADARGELDDKLEKAAEAIKDTSKKKKKKKSDKSATVIEEIGSAIGETIEDVVDTVKAVAIVVEEKIEDAMDKTVSDDEDAVDLSASEDSEE